MLSCRLQRCQETQGRPAKPGVQPPSAGSQPPYGSWRLHPPWEQFPSNLCQRGEENMKGVGFGHDSVGRKSCSHPSQAEMKAPSGAAQNVAFEEQPAEPAGRANLSAKQTASFTRKSKLCAAFCLLVMPGGNLEYPACPHPSPAMRGQRWCSRCTGTR